MFFAVKHIYLTLYIVPICRIAPIYSVPPALAAVRGRARVRPPAAVPACVRVPACVCARVCGRVCARGLLASVVRAYIVDSPAVLPRAGLAVNFFEIVFGQSISVRLSSAGMGDAS